MTADTVVTLPGNRLARIVPAEDAGQFRLELVAHCIIGQLRNAGLLDYRQGEALTHLRRVLMASGYRRPWRRAEGAGERPERVLEAAAEELADLLRCVRVAHRGSLCAMLGTDEYQTALRVRDVQDAADALADRLGLARETP